MRRLIGLIFLLILSSCKDTPISFDSPAILRGTWEGLAYDFPSAGDKTLLRLESTATYVSEAKYSFSGTFTLGGETPQSFSGEGGGSGYSFVRPATPAPVVTFSGSVPNLYISIRGSTLNPSTGQYNLSIVATCPQALPSCSPFKSGIYYYALINKTIP